MSYGVGCRRGSDPELLWLWRGLVATAPIGPQAWEPPYATEAAQEMAKKDNKQTNKKRHPDIRHIRLVSYKEVWVDILPAQSSHHK